MVGLRDIAPSTKTVSVGGVDVPVYGVSAKGVAYLFERFPELRKAFMRKEVDASEFTPEALMKLIPDGIAAVIACGCGSAGDAEAEEIASKLGVSDQATLLEAIMAQTMPQGVGPFVERLNALMAGLSVDTGKVSVGKSPKPSKR